MLKQFAGAEWDAAIGNPGVNGPVYGLAAESNYVYAIGSFTKAGNVTVRNLARWDGSVWSGIAGGVGSAGEYPSAIAVARGVVYVGGLLTNVYLGDGALIRVTNIAAWNGSTWSSMDGGLDGTVVQLATIGNDLYVGGRFTNAGGQLVRGVARWDGTNWFSLNGGVTGLVHALAVDGNNLYVGGSITSAGGMPVTNVARWDGTNWYAVPGFFGEVLTLAARNYEVSGASLDWFYRRSPTDSSATSTLPRVGNFYQTMAASESSLFRGGDLDLRRSDNCRDEISLGMSGIRAMALTEDSLYVGGLFSRAYISPAENIARWVNPHAYSVREGHISAIRGTTPTNVQFQVTVCRTPREPLFVQYATSNRTAIAGVDYERTEGTLTFSGDMPGTQVITVPVPGSDVYHKLRDFSMRFTGTNLIQPLVTYAGVQSSLPPPSLSVADGVVLEGDAGTNFISFTLSLSAPIADPLEVTLEYQDGTAISNVTYFATPGRVTIPARAVSRVFSVPILANTYREIDKQFTVRILYNDSQLPVSKTNAIGRIINDDPLPGILVEPTNRFQEISSEITRTVPVRLSIASSQTVTVDFATRNGTAIAGPDYTASAGKLTFAPGVTLQSVKLPIRGDRIFEPDEYFFLDFANASGNATLIQTQSTIWISNDDTIVVPAGFALTSLPINFTKPTRMEFAPDGRLFVCEQAGNIWIIRDGVRLAVPFLALGGKTVVTSEGGLLGITFDPGFATNQFVYVYYTASQTNGIAAHNRVSRFQAQGDLVEPGSEFILQELDPGGVGIHNGGDLHFGPDGKLYVSVGEGGTGTNSQTLVNRRGKLLRLNADGTIPSDNPFYAAALGQNRAIWAMGLRNPFAFSFQPDSGRVFINDVGDVTWEEINEGEAGGNYGWPLAEGLSTNTAFRSPLFVYANNNVRSNITGCAITAGIFYNPSRSQFPDEYVGNYFFTDFCSDRIFRLVLTNGVRAFEFASGVDSPVDLKVGPDGALYCLSHDPYGTSGHVFRIFIPGLSPRFLTINLLPGGGVALRIAAEPNRFYWLESSTNLFEWPRAALVVPPTEDSVFTHIPTGKASQRFYRLTE